ncbi:hypothetical protein ES702_04121 [subsurface metagenome]
MKFPKFRKLKEKKKEGAVEEKPKIDKYEKLEQRNNVLRNCLIIYILTCMFLFLAYSVQITTSTNSPLVILYVTSFGAMIQPIIIPVVFLIGHLTSTLSRIYGTINPPNKVFGDEYSNLTRKERKERKADEVSMDEFIQGLREKHGE